MNGVRSTDSLPITALSHKARNLVSLLLKSRKCLPSEGLPRDWRGLATLVNISAEVASSIADDPNCTAIVLERWLQMNDNTATIGNLYKNLQRLDRYDVYDDLKELESKGELIDTTLSNRTEFNQIAKRDLSTDFITYDDKRCNAPQRYHAYVLYAKEDKAFIDVMLSKMRAQKYRLCTEDDLLPGHSSAYAAVSRLIAERCHRCVLVYSPDFLSSPANAFYTDYVQAVGIESKQINMIPCMYRACRLPSNLTFYHKLWYSSPGGRAAYDFWDKLGQALETPDLPRIGVPTASASQSSVNITELEPSLQTGSAAPKDLLALPQTPYKTQSLNELNTLQVTLPDDSTSVDRISNQSLSSVEKAKKGKLQRIKKLFKVNSSKRKDKQVIMVEN